MDESSGTSSDQPETVTVEQVLDEVAARAREERQLSVSDVVEAAGHRTFAPLVLLVGLVMLAPGPADIPGVPVLLGLTVILIVGQMLFGRDHIWLPGWLARRSLRSDRVQKAIGWLRRPARFLDRITRPRLTWAVRHGGFAVIAVATLAVAMATPVMEVVPFSANLAGAVITAFGLSLVAQDGLLALIAVALAAATGGLLVYTLI